MYTVKQLKNSKVLKVINIGLDISKRFKNKMSNKETISKIENFLINNNIDYYSKLEKSSTEMTMIIYIFSKISKSLALSLSMVGRQDCVAVLDIDSLKGELIGKFKKFWGEFNSNYFIGVAI